MKKLVAQIFLMTVLVFVQRVYAESIPALAKFVCAKNTYEQGIPDSSKMLFVPYLETDPTFGNGQIITTNCANVAIDTCVKVGVKIPSFPGPGTIWDGFKYSTENFWNSDHRGNTVIWSSVKCVSYPRQQNWNPKEIGQPFTIPEWSKRPINPMVWNPDVVKKPAPVPEPQGAPGLQGLPGLHDLQLSPVVPEPVKPTIFFPVPTGPTGPVTIVPVKPDSIIYPFIAEVYRLMNDSKVQQWVKNSITTILVVGGAAAAILAIGGVVSAGASTSVSWVPLVAAGAAIIVVCNIAGVTVDKDALKMKNVEGSAQVTTEETGTGAFAVIATDDQKADVHQIDIQQIGKNGVTITNGETCFKSDSKNKNPGGC